MRINKLVVIVRIKRVKFSYIFSCKSYNFYFFLNGESVQGKKEMNEREEYFGEMFFGKTFFFGERSRRHTPNRRTSEKRGTF